MEKVVFVLAVFLYCIVSHNKGISHCQWCTKRIININKDLKLLIKSHILTYTNQA